MRPGLRIGDLAAVGQAGAGAAQRARAADTDLGNFLSSKRGQVVHLAGSLGINHWNGNRTPQLRIIDAASVDRP